MARKPRVSPLVPTRAVDRFLGRVHVGTADSDVLEAIQAAPGLGTDPRWTPTLLRQTLRYALWRHHANRDQYARVMGDHR